jgi:hypothetical protein
MGGIPESGYLAIWLFGYWTFGAGCWLLARLRVSRFGASAAANVPINNQITT